MKRLNLRIPKAYNYEDEAETILPRKRFYCVSEGSSEESYFYGVKNNRAELRIKNDVFIEVVPKEEGQETYSNPFQLTMACLRIMGHIDENEKEIPENEWNKNCKWEGFDPDIDIVCVIFDRDYRNFESISGKVFSLCRRHNIRIVISNPNFELWLLMHSPDFEKYDSDKLFENKKNLRYEIDKNASSNKKLLEILVSKNFDGYTKGSRLKFERFIPLIDKAVDQAKQFCQEPEKIRENMGTAVGRLIEDMRS